MACPKKCPFCHANEKEPPVIDDEENCHCGPCTAMNEPLTLEGDIRYLKAHIETKDRQLAEKDAAIADAEARRAVYRTIIEDYTSQVRILRKENKYYFTRITELEDTIMRSAEEKRIGGLGHNLGLQQENDRLREENKKLGRMVSGNGQHLIKLVRRIEDATAILNPKFD